MIEGVIESDICLKPMVTERSANLLRLHGHYKAGHLFQSGGISDQPNLYLEAMAEIEAAASAPD